MWRVVAILALCSCRADPDTCPPQGELGVFVAENRGCVRGCDGIGPLTRILFVDGAPIRSVADVEARRLADGWPHELVVRGRDESCGRPIEIVAFAAHGEPLVAADAAELAAAPDFARRRLFAHASPIVQLVGLDGPRLDGRSVVGRARLFVYWDYGDRIEEAAAISFMQVLQKAQEDLHESGVDIVFAHVQFGTSRRASMSADELRAWTERWALDLPMIPRFHAPPPSQHDRAREVGLARATRLLDNLGQSPAIVILDSRGIVRWHSEGLESPDTSELVQDPAQFTIIEAVKFALNEL